ncbi:hypothetical protein G6F59_015742 [Rhizopus arrhizus]|nr:hypothetical protein G6F59_015742 [Rhizopus arrhizus]
MRRLLRALRGPSLWLACLVLAGGPGGAEARPARAGDDAADPAVRDRAAALPGDFHLGRTWRGDHSGRKKPARVRTAGTAGMGTRHSTGWSAHRTGMADAVGRRRGRAAGPAGTLSDHCGALAA